MGPLWVGGPWAPTMLIVQHLSRLQEPAYLLHDQQRRRLVLNDDDAMTDPLGIPGESQAEREREAPQAPDGCCAAAGFVHCPSV